MRRSTPLGSARIVAVTTLPASSPLIRNVIVPPLSGPFDDGVDRSIVATAVQHKLLAEVDDTDRADLLIAAQVRRIVEDAEGHAAVGTVALMVLDVTELGADDLDRARDLRRLRHLKHHAELLAVAVTILDRLTLSRGQTLGLASAVAAAKRPGGSSEKHADGRRIPDSPATFVRSRFAGCFRDRLILLRDVRDPPCSRSPLRSSSSVTCRREPQPLPEGTVSLISEVTTRLGEVQMKWTPGGAHLRCRFQVGCFHWPPQMKDQMERS